MNINDAKTIVGVAIAVCIVVLILVGMMCWKYFLSPTASKSTDIDVDKMMREVFEENGYKYEVEKSDTVTVYTLMFNTGYGRLGIRINNHVERNYCYIFSYRNYDYAGKLNVVEKTSLLREINEYNDNSIFVSANLRDDNNINFQYGYIYDGGGFSKEAFDRAFHIVLNEADDEGPKIYLKAGILPETPKIKP